MSNFLKRSRTTKALAESLNIDFAEAENRLDSACISVVADDHSKETISGQAALLTAIATAKKTFSQVTLVILEDAPLHQPLPDATTLCSAAKTLGVHVASTIPTTTTHCVIMSSSSKTSGYTVRCWWGHWCAGVLPCWDERPLGENWNPLAGSYAGALAIREVFANILGQRVSPRASIISLWEPWSKAGDADAGPTTIYLPKSMWMIGLGHLGQGFLWNLGMIQSHGEKIILQDYQCAGPENEGTGLLTTSSSIGKHKTRIAAEWIEKLGWATEIIERKFTDKTEVTVDDPPFVIAGLDDLIPRLSILNAGFDYLIDSGVGHGAYDFDIAQIRVLPKGSQSNWNTIGKPKNIEKLLASNPYKNIDACGAFTLAQASVAVPFVGAAVGALALSQVLRITDMQNTNALVHIELSAPDYISASSFNPTPQRNPGGVSTNLLNN